MSETAHRRRIFDKLTALEQRFVSEFSRDWQGGPALKRAGSTAKNVNALASEMLRRHHIIEAISAKMMEMDEQLQVDRKWVQAQLVFQYHRASAAADGVNGKSVPAERANAIKILDKIGQLIDVQAFRQQVGIGNPDGTKLDLSGLSDDELDVWENLVRKAIGTGQRDGDS